MTQKGNFIRLVTECLDRIVLNDEDARLTHKALKDALANLKKNAKKNAKKNKAKLTEEDIQPFITLLADRSKVINKVSHGYYGNPLTGQVCLEIASSLAIIINDINKTGKKCKPTDLLMPQIEREEDTSEEEIVTDIAEKLLQDTTELEEDEEIKTVKEEKPETLKVLIQGIINRQFSVVSVNQIEFDSMMNAFFVTNRPDPSVSSRELLQLAIKQVSFDAWNLDQEKALFMLLAELYRQKRASEPNYNTYSGILFGSNQEAKTSAASLFEQLINEKWPIEFYKDYIDAYIEISKLSHYTTALYRGGLGDLIQKAFDRAETRKNEMMMSQSSSQKALLI